MEHARRCWRAKRSTTRRQLIVVIVANLNSTFSIMAFSDEHIVNQASKLGVSLGVSVKDSLNSARLIRECEANRELHVLQKNVTIPVNENGDPTSLVLSRVSCLSEYMEDEDLIAEDVDHLDLLPMPVKKSSKRGKRAVATSVRRRSARLKKGNSS